MKKNTALIIIFSFMIFSIVLTSFIQKIAVKEVKSNDNQQSEEKVDKTPPELVLKESKLIIYQDDILNYEAFIVSAKDDIDGDVSSLVEHNVIDTSEVGEYKLEYKVKDNAGNETIETINIIVREKLEVVED